MTQHAPILECLKARAFSLDLLRRIFIEEPTVVFLQLIASKNYLDIFPFQEEDKKINEGIQSIKDFLTEDFFQSKEAFEALHWDYTKLMVGPFELLAPPWESSYVRKDKLLFQQTTKEVEKFYKKTDDMHEDSPDFPQQRGCLRVRSQRHQVFSADRLKYPMKRKNWEPGGGRTKLKKDRKVKGFYILVIPNMWNPFFFY